MFHVEHRGLPTRRPGTPFRLDQPPGSTPRHRVRSVVCPKSTARADTDPGATAMPLRILMAPGVIWHRPVRRCARDRPRNRPAVAGIDSLPWTGSR